MRGQPRPAPPGWKLLFASSLVAIDKPGTISNTCVHCTEGLNRSVVVVARALMEMGLPPSDAIELVRRQRGSSVDGFPALGNQAFVDWLHREDDSATP